MSLALRVMRDEPNIIRTKTALTRGLKCSKVDMRIRRLVRKHGESDTDKERPEEIPVHQFLHFFVVGKREEDVTEFKDD